MTSRLGTLSIFFTAVLIADAALAQSARRNEAVSLCTQSLLGEYGAVGLSDIAVRLANNRSWVNGVAEYDGASYRFRCQVQYGEVRGVEYQVTSAGAGPTSEQEWRPAGDIARAGPAPRETETEEAPETAATPAATDPTEAATYRVNWGEASSPAEGITCYSLRRACYDADEKLNLFWTSKTFRTSE